MPVSDIQVEALREESTKKQCISHHRVYIKKKDNFALTKRSYFIIGNDTNQNEISFYLMQKEEEYNTFK